MAQIHLGDGKWLLSDCGSMPSDNNCKLVITSPENQKEDLLDAAIAHAVTHHGHQDTPDFRTKIGKTLVELE